MTSPTDDTVRLVWNELVDSDRMCRYYGYLAHRLKRLDHLLLYVTVMAALCSCTAVFWQLPVWVSLAFLNFAALSFALQIIRNYSEKADRSSEILRQLGAIQLEWELLWNNIWSKDDDALRSAWKKLSERQLAIVERVPCELPLSRSLARKSQREADRYWSEVARNGGIPSTSQTPDGSTLRYQNFLQPYKPEPDPPQRPSDT